MNAIYGLVLMSSTLTLSLGPQDALWNSKLVPYAFPNQSAYSAWVISPDQSTDTSGQSLNAVLKSINASDTQRVQHIYLGRYIESDNLQQDVLQYLAAHQWCGAGKPKLHSGALSKVRHAGLINCTQAAISQSAFVTRVDKISRANALRVSSVEIEALTFKQVNGQLVWISAAWLNLAPVEATESKVQQFADRLKRIIGDSDIDSFKSLPCSHAPCTDDAALLQTIFAGPSDITRYEQIMGESQLRIRIQGPMTIEPEFSRSSYLVTFYREGASPFDELGEIPTDIGLREFGLSFLQTALTVNDGEVVFHRVPFYVGAHHPYVSDY